jgi:hypothetical protein
MHAALETTHGCARLSPLAKRRAACTGLVTKTIAADLGFAVSCHGQHFIMGSGLEFCPLSVDNSGHEAGGQSDQAAITSGGSQQ